MLKMSADICEMNPSFPCHLEPKFEHFPFNDNGSCSVSNVCQGHNFPGVRSGIQGFSGNTIMQYSFPFGYQREPGRLHSPRSNQKAQGHTRDSFITKTLHLPSISKGMYKKYPRTENLDLKTNQSSDYSLGNQRGIICLSEAKLRPDGRNFFPRANDITTLQLSASFDCGHQFSPA